ncbi:hypothetical protein FACS1894152_6930 [Bacilli bacterium]|nr:hypothetical protein FACS1894152_6930 [Bacilli bacterium]
MKRKPEIVYSILVNNIKQIMTGEIDTKDLYFRIKTIKDCLADKLSRKDVSELLKMAPRQVRNLIKRYREEGKA